MMFKIIILVFAIVTYLLFDEQAGNNIAAIFYFIAGLARDIAEIAWTAFLQWLFGEHRVLKAVWTTFRNWLFGEHRILKTVWAAFCGWLFGEHRMLKAVGAVAVRVLSGFLKAAIWLVPRVVVLAIAVPTLVVLSLLLGIAGVVQYAVRQAARAWTQAWPKAKPILIRSAWMALIPFAGLVIVMCSPVLVPAVALFIIIRAGEEYLPKIARTIIAWPGWTLARVSLESMIQRWGKAAQTILIIQPIHRREAVNRATDIAVFACEERARKIKYSPQYIAAAAMLCSLAVAWSALCVELPLRRAGVQAEAATIYNDSVLDDTGREEPEVQTESNSKNNGYALWEGGANDANNSAYTPEGGGEQSNRHRCFRVRGKDTQCYLRASKRRTEAPDIVDRWAETGNEKWRRKVQRQKQRKRNAQDRVRE